MDMDFTTDLTLFGDQTTEKMVESVRGRGRGGRSGGRSSQRVGSYSFDLPVEVHVTTVLLYEIIGLIGNSLVLYIYLKRKKNYAGNIYIIALAVLDLMACLVLLPQYPLIPFYVGERRWMRPVYFMTNQAISISYKWLLATMAIDRLVAIYKPFTYRVLRSRVIGVLFSMYILRVAWSLAMRYNLLGLSHIGQPGTSSSVFFAFHFATNFISYSAIVFKLYRQGHKMKAHKAAGGGTAGGTKKAEDKNRIEIEKQPHSTTVSTNLTLDTEATATAKETSGQTNEVVFDTIPEEKEGAKRKRKQQGNKRSSHEMHVTTAKIFLSVLFIYLFSFLPVTLTARKYVSNFYFTYLYFINHVANPIAYYVINTKFREDVNGIFRKLRK